MAWFDELNSPTSIASYENERTADREIKSALALGWVMKDTSGVFGTLEIGRTLSKLAAATGIDAIFGPEGARGRFTVTWERDPGTVKVLEEEGRVARLKTEYNNLGGPLANSIKKIMELQSRNMEGPRTAETAKSLGEELAERGRAAARRSDAALRLADGMGALLMAYAASSDASPINIDIVGRLREEAERLTANAALDDAASDQIRDFAVVAKTADDAAKLSQDVAKRVGAAIMRIAQSEQRVLTARDDLTRERFQRELQERKSDLEREEADRADADVARTAREAERDEARTKLPQIAAY